MNFRLLISINCLFLFIVLISAGCGGNKTSIAEKPGTPDTLKQIKLSAHDDSVEKDFQSRIQRIAVGDLNGDGVVDTAIVIPPRYNDPADIQQGCKDSCYCRIRFTNGMPDIASVIGTGETIWPVGDLDGNGFVELGMIPDWPTSVWQRMAVYGFKDKQWKCYAEVSINLNCMYNDSNYFTHRIASIDKTHFRMIQDSLGDNDSLYQIPKIFILK
jgi:hypothetical protein